MEKSVFNPSRNIAQIWYTTTHTHTHTQIGFSPPLWLVRSSQVVAMTTNPNMKAPSEESLAFTRTLTVCTGRYNDKNKTIKWIKSP